MAQLVKVRRLSDAEGQKLQRIVRRGSTNTVRYRRAMIVLASAGGNSVPVIARLVQADEDTVREVVHKFNEKGLACLDPNGREAVPVCSTVTTRTSSSRRPPPAPACSACRSRAGRCGNSPPTCAEPPGRCIRIGRETLRCLLIRHQITFQRTKTWKESTDPDKDAKLDRIEYALHECPDRTFAFDEFGPLSTRPTAGPAGPGRAGLTGSRPPSTAPTECATSTAATPSATTRSEVSTGVVADSHLDLCRRKLCRARAGRGWPATPIYVPSRSSSLTAIVDTWSTSGRVCT
ncbi:helix-turn-helix domain-containing protein [Micromonospora sp. DR5-3]|uniref:helix-turn-helix domain-containing protein n=1 Tax=Micromonospora sp. DR5-3 TaxID=2992129 RepID=UPI0029F56E1D|nr:helix-turn-helix domain-containing protein [Micromonospora sp. DR5-3]